jgi:ubiquinone/menaquinone biosynthesis C-methylase UbiE
LEKQSGWQLSGSGPEAYERYIAAPITKPCVPGLFAAAALDEGERVLDVGCGTGVVARMAADRVGATGRVTGIDLNAGMLAAAREFAGDGTAAGIEWRQGDATALPVDDDDFDVVFCQQALQFVPDKAEAAREMHRVLTPGGRLACSVLRELRYNPYQQAVANALERHVDAKAAAVIHTPFSYGDADALRRIAAEAGFNDVHVRLEVGVMRFHSLEELIPGYIASTPAAGRISELDEAVQRAIIDDVKASLKNYVDDDGLAAPLEFYVLTGSTSS